MNVIRLLVFTLIIPGIVAGYIPYVLNNNQDTFDLPGMRYLGAFLISLGIGLYGWSALSFLLTGKGTPAIWFAKRLKFLLGEEPVMLVSSGLYRISRNPMYLGVLLIVFGQAFFFESYSILVYGALLFMFFHLVIIWLEEPHLKKKYGQGYKQYINQTPRWIGVKRKSKGRHKTRAIGNGL